MRHLFDIIIPTFNNPKYTVTCLKSIKRHTDNYRVIWVDNGSTKESIREVQKQLSSMPCLEILSKERLGFVKAVNLGLKESIAPNIIIQNNDTIVTSGWAEKLRKTPFGIAGPITSPCDSWQSAAHLHERWGVPAYTGHFNPEIEIDLLIKSSDDYNKTLEKTYPGKTREVKGNKRVSGMVAFFCALIRREVFELIGPLKEDYGEGFGDDDDFCWRASTNKFRIGIALDCFVFHYHRMTFKSIYSDKEIEHMKNENLDTFLKKLKKNKKWIR